MMTGDVRFLRFRQWVLTVGISLMALIVYGQKAGSKKPTTPISEPKSALYFPDANWSRRLPGQVGMNASLVDSAVSLAMKYENSADKDLRIYNLKSYSREPNYYLAGPTKMRGGPAGLIIKNGYIVAEWGDIQRVDMTFSVTKSYLSTVAGLALEEGLIGQVQDKLGMYVWDDKFEGDHNGKISWEHLLNQSSDWSGTLFGMHDWADRPPREGNIDDWRYRKLNEPGTVFEYNDVRVNLLAYALLQVWRKPLPMILKERIMDPIGASTTWRWHGYGNSYVNLDGLMMQSVSGGGHHGGGIFINTLDHGRFGLLFCRNGQWKDNVLVSEKWISQAMKPSPSNPSYGYMWWLNTDQNLPGLSDKVFYAIGAGGNYIVVDQEQDLVVVFRWLDNSKLGEVMALINQAID